MNVVASLRRTLTQFLDGGQAFAPLDKILADWPEDLRGKTPHGLPYSGWKLLEHIRISQRDILDFCRDQAYEEPAWPDDYWPEQNEPPSPEAWDESVRQILADRDALRALVNDDEVNLAAAVPQGDGQTYAREAILVAVHNAYHLGQIVVLRRLLGIWE